MHAATAVKLEEEFNKLRAQLEKALSSFRLSGMGDTCAAEDVEEKCYKVYSSRFADFCDGKPVVLYAYELLVREDGMLFSFSTQMPMDSSHTSESRRSVREASESEVSRKSKRASEDAFGDRMLAMFKEPVKVNFARGGMIDKSLKKKRELEAKAAQVDYDEKLLKQLVTLSDMIDTYEKKGASTAPMLDVLRRKKADVEESLAKSCVASVQVSEDGGCTPGPSSAKMHPNAGSSDVDEDSD